MRRLLMLIVITAAVTAINAQGPNGSGRYYKAANGKTGAKLKTALFEIIRDPNVVSYGTGLKLGYIRTDTRPDGYLRDFYSCITNYVPGSNMAAGQYEGYNYNREHTVCQSWFKSETPMMSDIIQVIPTDGYINSRRNDNPFGEVTDKVENIKTSEQGYSKWGAPRNGLLPDTLVSKVTTVFEPNDEVKGDIARIYFYMATCYQDRATTFTGGKGAYVFNAHGTEYEPLQPWVMEMMMRWSAIDPVDSIETARNDSAYAVQGNRNPFVDYPGLEDYVWGDRQQEPFVYGDDESGDDEEEFSQSGTILLNNEFFGVDWNGQRPSGGVITMSGKTGGITVTYAKGSSGQNMFCNSSQIRLYKYNILSFSINDGDFRQMDFNVVANANNKPLVASCGTIDGYTWTGDTRYVEFMTDNQNGNIQLASVDIVLNSSSVQFVAMASQQTDRAYDLQGRRIDTSKPMKRGLYIMNGKKYFVR